MNKLYFSFVIFMLTCALASCKKEQDAQDLTPTPTPTPNTTNYLNPNLTYGSVTDFEGNAYATIQIGAQEWMAENLRATKYCNGDAIDNVIDNTQWGSLMTGAWSYFSHDSTRNIPYGKLYNWYAASDIRNICPCGWHVPSLSEFTALISFLGEQQGGKLKSVGNLDDATGLWSSPNSGATNESGFSGLPGGYRLDDGSFSNVNNYGYFWSRTSNTGAFSASAHNLRLQYSSANLTQGDLNKVRGLSVRCIRD